jgi:hypothetical protein
VDAAVVLDLQLQVVADLRTIYSFLLFWDRIVRGELLQDLLGHLPEMVCDGLLFAVGTLSILLSQLVLEFVVKVKSLGVFLDLFALSRRIDLLELVLVDLALLPQLLDDVQLLPAGTLVMGKVFPLGGKVPDP